LPQKSRDQAPAAEAQHALPRAAQQHRLVVQAQQLAVGQPIGKTTVLDLGHRLPHQGQCVQVGQARVAGYVQHPQALAVRVHDRYRRAGEDAVRGEVVFATAYLQRTAFHQRGADRVGAHAGFVPAHARHQRDTASLVQEAGAAFGIQDPAILVGQQHDAAAVGHLRRQAFQFGPGLPPQPFAALPQLAQAAIGQRFGIGLRVHQQAMALAALPRVQDGVGHRAHRRRTAFEETAPGTAQARVGSKRGHRQPPVSHSATVVSGPVPINSTSRASPQGRPLLQRRSRASQAQAGQRRTS